MTVSESAGTEAKMDSSDRAARLAELRLRRTMNPPGAFASDHAGDEPSVDLTQTPSRTTRKRRSHAASASRIFVGASSAALTVALVTVISNADQAAAKASSVATQGGVAQPNLAIETVSTQAAAESAGAIIVYPLALDLPAPTFNASLPPTQPQVGSQVDPVSMALTAPDVAGSPEATPTQAAPAGASVAVPSAVLTTPAPPAPSVPAAPPGIAAAAVPATAAATAPNSPKLAGPVAPAAQRLAGATPSASAAGTKAPLTAQAANALAPTTPVPGKQAPTALVPTPTAQPAGTPPSNTPAPTSAPVAPVAEAGPTPAPSAPAPAPETSAAIAAPLPEPVVVAVPTPQVMAVNVPVQAAPAPTPAAAAPAAPAPAPAPAATAGPSKPA